MPEETFNADPPKSFGWPFWLLLGGMIVIFMGFSFPRIVRSKMQVDQVKAIGSLRQIGLCLVEFENNFGRTPNEETAIRILAKHPQTKHDLRGRSSNAMFRQLFAEGQTTTEEIFYAKVPGARKPDDDMSPGQLLRQGEVAFACVAGLSSKGNPARPVAFAPVVPGTTRFDPEPFGGRAVFLRMDNSVCSMTIGKDGRVLAGGVDILSPENPIWGGLKPDIRYPDL